MESKKPLKNLEKSDNQFPVVGVGASAGGLDAFKKLLRAIPENSGIAYVLVQHLDPDHVSVLPELLQKVTPVPVQSVTDDIKILPDNIYVIPRNRMMIANDGVLELTPRPEKGKSERNLSIDLFFRSLAEIHGLDSIGVILSGTGTDGTLGLKSIKDAGGITFAQDEDSAAYPDMPRSAIATGIVDFVLPPEEIPKKLMEVSKLFMAKGDENEPSKDEDVLKGIISLLHVRRGTDFTHYKQTTIQRRILRRVVITQTNTPAEYLKYLRQNKQEQDRLFLDLLIPVTEFFRDPETFDKFGKTVFPQILKNRSPDVPVRIWVAGCSTGQEVYSISIALHELLSSDSLGEFHQKVQIFASDISTTAIEKARSGNYSENDIKGVSKERLRSYFTKNNGDYRISDVIRNTCVFAVHNFLKDPPFGKIDLISCRNVLIYMDSYLQKRALTTFHYALNPNGFLWLGKTETTSTVPAHFSAFSKKDKFFVRKKTPENSIPISVQHNEPGIVPMIRQERRPVLHNDFQKIADNILLNRFAPAGVVINEAMDIVQFRGGTGRYLEPAPGRASLNLLKMAHQGLAFELRNIIHKAKKENKTVIRENIHVRTYGNGEQIIGIEAIPLPNMEDPHYMILFKDQGMDRIDPSDGDSGSNTNPVAGEKTEGFAIRIKELEQELAHTREDMRSITQEQEAANEELQSANEELLSSSEELQTLNEELETGKEELQSTNEELMAVNQETIGLNEQLIASLEYNDSIMETLHEAFLVLDSDLLIKFANPSFYRTFRINEKNTLGKLIHQLGDGQWNFPIFKNLMKDILPKKIELENFEISGNIPHLGKRTMLMNAREIKRGKEKKKMILLAIEDITERAKLREKEKDLLQKFENLLNDAPVALTVLRVPNYIVELANSVYLDMMEKDTDLIGRPIFESMPELKNQGIRAIIDGVIQSGAPYRAKELELNMHRKKKSRAGFYDVVFQPLYDEQNKINGVILVINEVTSQAILQKKMRESENHFRLLAERMPAKISNKDKDGRIIYLNNNWVDFTGLEIEDLMGFGYKKIMHPDEIEEFEERCQLALETGTDLEMEMRYMNKDGDYVWHLNILSPVFDENGAFRMWIGITYVITEEIKFRKKTKTHTDELEELVAQRTSELKNTNEELTGNIEKLTKINDQLESFTYISSHDLQEPLRKIQIYADRLLEIETDNLSGKGKEYFRIMQDSANRMQALIKDLLDFSHVDKYTSALDTVNLLDIIMEIKTALIEEFDKKEAVLEMEGGGDLMVTVVEIQFRQVIQNILTNALKFSRPGHPPHIRINIGTIKGNKLSDKKLSPEKNYHHISIADNGIGFKKEFEEKIFGVFQKLHSKDQYPGTGIGLSIVKKIVENHEGKITATSKLGKGTTFDIYIPTSN